MTGPAEPRGARREDGGSPPHMEVAYRELRPLLFSIAYRMLASVGDAEDIVQEAFIRYHRASGDTQIGSPKAYLSAVVTRLSIDRLRSAAVRREVYVGQWLPEPLLTDGKDDDPVLRAEQADSLSMAFMLVLERLNPVERAVFLLREVFDYGYAEIAQIVQKTDSTCRQLAVRARRHVREERPRFEADRRRREELARRFFTAFTDGDVGTLVEMLAEDAVTYGDGGGKAPQWSRPIVGAERVARLFLAMSKQVVEHALVVEPHEVNGQPGAVMRTANGELINVFALDIADGLVHAIRSVINPDKLQHLGPVVDLGSMTRGREGS